MAVQQIRLLGNPALYRISKPVQRGELEGVVAVVADLRDTLLDFRKRRGAGRAIAAPQIGVTKRLVYMDTADGTTVFINPELVDRSTEMIELWDDCMSFPGLQVRVRRHRSCRIRHRNLDWEWEERALEGASSELLQHEVDHLDGILAVSRAIDDRSLSLKKDACAGAIICRFGSPADKQSSPAKCGRCSSTTRESHMVYFRATDRRRLHRRDAEGRW